MKLPILFAILTLPLLSFAAEGQTTPCPPDLLKAAEGHRTALNAVQGLIKASTLENPVGVEPTQTFDVSTHDCHMVPGQAYRDYAEGVCEVEPGGTKAVVRYAYRLFFRRGISTEALFAEPFKEGSDGILQVSFERVKTGWEPAGSRETLPLGDTKKGHKGPPIPEK